MSNVNKHNLWPSENYIYQVEKLKNSINKKIYLIELRPNYVHIAIHHTGDAYQLLAIIDFPKPDPEKGLFPHFVLLDDGRGINLGRIARVITHKPTPQTKNTIDDQGVRHEYSNHIK